MKHFKLLFLPLLAIVFSLSGCEQIGNLGKKNKFTESGLYLGIIGFNSDLQEKEITLLNENSKYDMINFINNLNMEKETILFYAVDEAINKLENTTFPSDIKSVNIVTFTDGLDVGSIRKNGEYKTDSEYLKAINTRLKETKISGLDINAYSIGIAGSDVTNKAKFKDNLIGLATAKENAFEVSNMKEVNNKFEQIANSLYKKNTIPSLTLRVPYHGDGVKIRYTFDNIGNNITKSTQYIEATFKIISETEIKLENFYFKNCKCDNISNNSQLTISVKSEKDPFLLKLEPNAISTTAIAFSPKDASSDDSVCKSPAVSTSSVMPASFNVSKDIRPFFRYTLYSLLQHLKAEIIAFAATPSGLTRFTGSPAQWPHPHPLPRRRLISFAVAS